tara:strand:- start:346 stop:1365 length:1020 start_codon:yes stop_codon:yes gene_type:complete
MLKKYDSCSFCKSKKFKLSKEQKSSENFYIKAIRSDLKISSKIIRKMKVFQCLNCSILQNNPWFDEKNAKRIYSNIYGQHNKNWSNLLSFINKKKLPNHGRLFEILQKNIKIKNYAEFNSPFMGLFLDFFNNEYKTISSYKKNIFNKTMSYLVSRQVAGRSKKYKKSSLIKSRKLFNQISRLKKVNYIKKKTSKILFVENSSISWGQNDNYKSVNSKSLASELLDIDIYDIKDKWKKKKIDLFGLFLTLDHTFNPKNILDYALAVSKYVVVQCHIDQKLNKQHLFSFTENFTSYLNKQKIYTLNLNKEIKKKFKSPEMYFACSKNKNYIKFLKSKFDSD